MDSQELIPTGWLKALEDAYFLGFDADQYFEPLEQRLKDVRGPFISPGNAFWNNLEALIAVASIPILLASGTATQMRFQQMSMAERIRRIPVSSGPGHAPSDLTAKDEEEAHRVAHERLMEELSTKEGIR